MPHIDITITISVIVALCAIISPIATALINNHHQLRIKKMDLEQKDIEKTILYKRTVFENYLKYAGRCIAYANDSAQKDYGEYYFLALLYAPHELRSDMIQAHEAMNDCDWTSATLSFEKLTPKIHDLLQKL